MPFIIVDSKIDSILSCYTSISEMKKTQNIPNKDFANSSQSLVSVQKSRFI